MQKPNKIIYTKPNNYNNYNNNNNNNNRYVQQPPQQYQPQQPQYQPQPQQPQYQQQQQLQQYQQQQKPFINSRNNNNNNYNYRYVQQPPQQYQPQPQPQLQLQLQLQQYQQQQKPFINSRNNNNSTCNKQLNANANANAFIPNDNRNQYIINQQPKQVPKQKNDLNNNEECKDNDDYNKYIVAKKKIAQLPALSVNYFDITGRIRNNGRDIVQYLFNSNNFWNLNSLQMTIDKDQYRVQEIVYSNQNNDSCRVYRFSNATFKKHKLVKIIEIKSDRMYDHAAKEIIIGRSILSYKNNQLYTGITNITGSNFLGKINTTKNKTKKAGYLAIELENISGFNLRQVVNNRTLSDDQLSRLNNNILNGINYLNKIGVLHNDLKPANILYDSKTREFKLCDYGLSIIAPDHKLFQYNDISLLNKNLSLEWRISGTPEWFSPEKRFFYDNYMCAKLKKQAESENNNNASTNKELSLYTGFTLKYQHGYNHLVLKEQHLQSDVFSISFICMFAKFSQLKNQNFTTPHPLDAQKEYLKLLQHAKTTTFLDLVLFGNLSNNVAARLELNKYCNILNNSTINTNYSLSPQLINMQQFNAIKLISNFNNYSNAMTFASDPQSTY